MLPCEVGELPSSEADLLARYWAEEPWGPWRDNLHTAIIAREVLRASGRFNAPKLDAFMVQAPAKIAQQGRAAGKSFMGMMKSIAVRKKRVKPK